MTNTSVRPVRKVLGILTGVSAAYAGIRLILSCLGIYRSGPFTPEIVAAAFAPIAWSCYLCLALIALGLILDFCFPAPAEKPKASQTNAQILARLGGKADFNAWEETQVQELTELERKRCRAAALRNLVFLFCTVLFLVFALNSRNFHSSQINESMIRAMWVLVPCLVLSFAAAVSAHYYIEKNRRQSIALLKQAPTTPAKTPAAAPQPSRNTLKLVVVCLAGCLILLGFFTGGTADVLTKAVNICTECVGLG